MHHRYVYVTGLPSDIMKKSLIKYLSKESFRNENNRKKEKDNSNRPDDALNSGTSSSSSDINTCKKSGRSSRKKEPRKVEGASLYDVEKRALEALEELRLKKRAIFTRIRERKERKKEMAENH